MPLNEQTKQKPEGNLQGTGQGREGLGEEGLEEQVESVQQFLSKERIPDYILKIKKFKKNDPRKKGSSSQLVRKLVLRKNTSISQL